MPDPQQLTLNLPPHRNHGLFADHYLDHVLPGRADWLRLVGDAAPVLAEVTRIFTVYVPSADEQQTEYDLVRPILDALGHTYEVQGHLRVPGRIHKPDYVFYRNLEARNANRNTILDKTLPAHGGFAVGDAKYWGRPLDCALRESGAGADSNQNPAFQIYWYMLHSGVEWGIVTNGKLWRLVHRGTADRLDVYYEVDLQELVRTGDVRRFLYFYAFFHRTAFDPSTDSGQAPGQLGLAELLRASTEYAHGVGASLKNQVYDALRHVAQGFLDYAPNNLQPAPETLKSIYDNALILLYRLIFILYAEARELLPIRENAQYRDTYSLQAIKHVIARDITAGRRLLPTSARIWQQLKELFSFIDRGEPPLHIATFNGGLFDPQKHPFLEQYVVGDHHLQQAIDMLVRVHGEFIDYRDLAVRHMGTIYEGLLEYYLQPLAAPEAGWSLEIVNDKGERKATGSYYTPDYIVKFIVERAVGPALHEAIAGKADDAARVKAVLEVNVLDPAMGSGHFLVEATEYIARYLVDLGVAPVGKAPEEADLAYWKRRVVQSCIYGVDLNPLAVELAKLSLRLITVAKDRPLSFLDHHLRPGDSLVGARLTALQAHDTTTVRRTRRRSAPAISEEQASLFGDADFIRHMATAVDSMWIIEGSESITVEQVKSQEQQYDELRRQLVGKYGKLADLLTARFYGITVPADQWRLAVDFVMGRALGAPQVIQQMVQQAIDQATKARFFHWELEFPEVFFDRHGRSLGEDGGFEAVIGNPPYIRQEQLAPYKPYLQESYQTFHGMADVYLYFYERGMEETKRGGRLAYISSGTFARANFAGPFRQWLPVTAQLETIIDFGENQPFPGAEMVRPSIVLLRKNPIAAGFRSLFIAGKIPASLDTALDEDGLECDATALEQSEWTFQSGEYTRLSQKIMHAGQSLSEVVDGRLLYGIKTGLNDAFIIDQLTRDRLVTDDPSCSPLLKKILRGEDLRPWYQEDEGRWLLALPCGWTARYIGAGLSEEDAWNALFMRHPSIAAHLAPFTDAARQRCDKGEYWWELRPCDYYDAFNEPKIFWPDVSKLPRFSWGDPGVLVGNTGYFIPASSYQLGLLQSRVLWFAASSICQPLRLRAGLWQYRMFTQFIERLPVPDAPVGDREVIGTLSMAITEHARARYALHQRVHHRLQDDLGRPGVSLNKKLTAWWELDFPSLRAEVKKVFRHDIPLADRDDWEAYHATHRTEYARLTAEIVRLEEVLNSRVYAIFQLTPEEIAIIEESTKYRYGEV